MNEYSHRCCRFLETEGGAVRKQGFTNTLLGSLVYFQASFSRVLGGKPGRGSPTQRGLSLRTLSAKKPWCAETQSNQNPKITLVFVCAVTPGKSQPFHESPERQPEVTSVTQHVPPLSNRWTLSQLTIPSDFRW